ncbi:FAD binding domain-containing protein [Pelagicoccus sp. SDUM812002]|uniref:FAD binding domain-containing protein n=1 Tax=Pelagicoccus sp. SDUM812002 TaxID=3041266 RepID=UPI00280ED3D9|nr:FAD binding domain-containing protein [Pelagicoccus sp. SDUM812002]MDQ8187760.1 FAD binding domain-containing protein [Pelagicoccus sp. SDUM812002]
MSQTTQITFLLNHELLILDVAPAMVALDFLRKLRQLTGSKEGCKEGDCGACTVIVGELQEESIQYRPMTSCLLPMGELHGKHLVSIEGLNLDKLSPVQSAMVDCGGTQCGYCTPGFVVAMTAGLMDPTISMDSKGHDFATSGNLCRCTGYRSIKNAGEQVFENLRKKLEGKPRIEALADLNAIPHYFRAAADQLASIQSSTKPQNISTEYTGPIVAGGTDLFVQKGEELPDTNPRLLNRQKIEAAQEKDGVVRLDAGMTFEAFARDPLIKEAIPNISDFNDLMASWPVRTRATLAGNICNASPIADMTCLLLALEAELAISSRSGLRIVPLKKFYLRYKQLAKEPDEVVSEIRFAKPTERECVHWEKVSKRKILDIATVNAASKFEVKNSFIARACLAVGGVAATPLFLQKASDFLSGKELTVETVSKCLEIAQSEFNPISDVRGSASYKRLLARQLLASQFTGLFPEKRDQEALYATLR